MSDELKSSTPLSDPESWDADSTSHPLTNDGTYRLKFDWSKAARWPSLVFMILTALAIIALNPFFRFSALSGNTALTIWLISTAVIALSSYIIYIETRISPSTFHWLVFIFTVLLLLTGGFICAQNTFDVQDPTRSEFLIPFLYFCYLGVLAVGHISEFARRKYSVPLWLRLFDSLGSCFLLILFVLFVLFLNIEGLPGFGDVIDIFIIIYVLSFPILSIFGLISNFYFRYKRIRHITIYCYAIIFPLLGYSVFQTYGLKMDSHYCTQLAYAWAFLFAVAAYSGGWLVRARVFERVRYDIRVTSEAEEDGWDDEKP